MEDLGSPGSYLTLEPGTPVYFSDGVELGKVARVLAEQDADIFEGVDVDPGLLASGRFVAAELIEEIFERGVVLTLASSEGESLPGAASR